MDSLDNEYSNITLPPDVEMSDAELASADDYLPQIFQYVRDKRFIENGVDQTVYVYAETAISIAHWAYLENYLQWLRKVLVETLPETDGVSEPLVRLSQVIAAYNSICEQMGLVFLNLLQIDREMFDDKSVSEKVVTTAESMVEDTKQDIREWVQELKMKYEYQMPPKQLELDLGIG